MPRLLWISFNLRCFLGEVRRFYKLDPGELGHGGGSRSKVCRLTTRGRKVLTAFQMCARHWFPLISGNHTRLVMSELSEGSLLWGINAFFSINAHGTKAVGKNEASLCWGSANELLWTRLNNKKQSQIHIKPHIEKNILNSLCILFISTPAKRETTWTKVSGHCLWDYWTNRY